MTREQFVNEMKASMESMEYNYIRNLDRYREAATQKKMLIENYKEELKYTQQDGIGAGIIPTNRVMEEFLEKVAAEIKDGLDVQDAKELAQIAAHFVCKLRSDIYFVATQFLGANVDDCDLEFAMEDDGYVMNGNLFDVDGNFVTIECREFCISPAYINNFDFILRQ